MEKSKEAVEKLKTAVERCAENIFEQSGTLYAPEYVTDSV